MRRYRAVIGGSGVLWGLLLCIAPAMGFECAFHPPKEDLARWSRALNEHDIGKWAAESLKRLRAAAALFKDEEALLQRVLPIADKLRQVVRRRDDIRYTVGVVNTSELGACAYPGGYVLLTRGLIEKAANPEELAMVIAHEFAHIAMAHMDNPIEHTLLKQFDQLEQFLKEKGAIGDGFISEYRHRFCDDATREAKELEADEYAIVYVFLAGYTPAFATAVLHKVGTATDSACQPSIQKRMDRMAAHVQRIIAQVDKFDAGVRFYVQQDYPRALDAFRSFLKVYQGVEVYHNLATASHRLALRFQAPERQLKAQCSLAFAAQTRAADFDLRTPKAHATFQSYLTAAMEDYGQARRQDPQYVPTLVNLACAYLEQGKYGTAQDLLKEALQVDPKNAVAYNNLGVMFRLQGHDDTAGVHWQKAVELDSRYATPQCNLARLWTAQGKADQAHTAWRHYLKLVGPGDTPCEQEARPPRAPSEPREPPGKGLKEEIKAAPVRPGALFTPFSKPGA